jgi:hypothetical protein
LRKSITHFATVSKELIKTAATLNFRDKQNVLRHHKIFCRERFLHGKGHHETVKTHITCTPTDLTSRISPFYPGRIYAFRSTVSINSVHIPEQHELVFVMKAQYFISEA